MKLVLQIAAGLVLAALIISFLPSIGYAIGALAAVLMALLPLAFIVAVFASMWAIIRHLRRPRPSGDAADHG